MVERTVGFGVIGCGLVAPSHVHAIQVSRGGRLVAVADIDEGRAARLGEQAGVPSYSDPNALLERPDIDVVCICTPNGAHSEPALAAARAGKHVVIEKPLDISLERVDAIIEACDKAKVKLCAVFPARFHEATQRSKHAIDQGRLGRLLLGNLMDEASRSPAYYLQGVGRGTWQRDGGGALMVQGIHGVDLLLYLMGPVESVSAQYDTLVHRIEVEDTVVASLRFCNGAMGTIAAATSLARRRVPGGEIRCEVYGDQGMIRLHSDEIEVWEVPGDELARPERPVEAGHGAPGDSLFVLDDDEHVAQIQDMIDAIRDDREPMVNGHEGRRAIQLILGIYESSRTGRPVRFTI